MSSKLWSLYALMLKSRLLEEAIAELWRAGHISGEMHLGTGEEAVVAGVVSHLGEGDAMALDHRGTAALLMRGVDPVAILRELLGRPDGLCAGRGGHMHLFSNEHLSASSGIVGAAGPAAAGFGLAAQYLRPGKAAVAFFGDGAMNQGMLLESMNLAAVWRLPVLFVCKDDGWAITTQPGASTRGTLEDRARGLGLPAVTVDGLDVAKVWEEAGSALEHIRSGRGPVFLHARCVHFEGHFLGFQLIRLIRRPLRELSKISLPLVRAFLRRGGAGRRERLDGMRMVLGAMRSTWRDPRRAAESDPVRRAERALRSEPGRLRELQDRLRAEVRDALASAREGAAL